MSEDAHSRPSGDAPEPLYDVNIPTPTHAERARTLVAQISTGTLCTLAHELEGYHYGSFVTVAFDEGNPIFLISGLAEHTKNLERDSRASLLVAEGGAEDPLANGRVTMLGPCTRVEGDGGGARAAFLTAHPNADHADAIVLYCKAFSKATDISSAKMTGVDRYGFEMSAKTPTDHDPFASRSPSRSARRRKCAPRWSR
jgi:putative heme iron utilization protein